MKTQDRIILGIDPGTSIMGYGIIQASKPKPTILAIGVVNLKKYKDHYVTIKTIYDKTYSLIDQYLPDELAIEAPFYGKNIQSMLKLGRAQGAAISAALNRDIPIFEYAPRKIKMSITGNGNASKEQVAAFLTSYLSIEDIPDSLDATDGLAAAVCHYFQKSMPGEKKSYKSWKDFVNKNPGKVKG
ncbi:MAG: crossover junction endodeoxyribonuclease RuvC [Bacteroidales bacterium]|nr:crossover junction endodeoxyribonuclease RuvC [Bacteroidales bacterium]MCF8454887.1 crossover junction endodeoxyribonuclease RuvC [Bacteroidales bacterium]